MPENTDQKNSEFGHFSHGGNKSLKNVLNSNGLRIDPQGTPDKIISKRLCILFILTHCILLLK